MSNNMVNNDALQNHLKQSISDICDTKKRTARDILFLGCCALLSRPGMAGGNSRGQRVVNVAFAQRGVLKH